jgi:hypothetical protein
VKDVKQAAITELIESANSAIAVGVWFHPYRQKRVGTGLRPKEAALFCNEMLNLDRGVRTAVFLRCSANRERL